MPTNVRVLVFSLSFLAFVVIFVISFDWHDYTLNVPAEYARIEDAVGAAVDGDKVLIAPGTYTCALPWVGKRLMISGSGVDSTVVTFKDFFAGAHKDSAGVPTTSVRVGIANMSIKRSSLLLSDTLDVRDAVIAGSNVRVRGHVQLENVLLHHSAVDVQNARLVMDRVTAWDNADFALEFDNKVHVERSIIQPWRAMAYGMNSRYKGTEFHVERSFTGTGIHSDVRDWIPRFRNTSAGDYLLCEFPPVGPIGAQFGR